MKRGRVVRLVIGIAQTLANAVLPLHFVAAMVTALHPEIPAALMGLASQTGVAAARIVIQKVAIVA